MRKRAAGVEGQRREHRKDRLAEVLVGDGQLLFVQRGVIQHLNAGFGQRRQQLVVQAFVRIGQQLLGLAADGHQLSRRMHAVGTHIQDSGIHLVDQAGHAHHEKLVHIGAHDGKEFDALQQRIAFVLGLLQHPELKREQAQLAVDIELRRTQGRNFRRGLALRRRRAGLLGGHVSTVYRDVCGADLHVCIHVCAEPPAPHLAESVSRDRSLLLWFSAARV